MNSLVAVVRPRVFPLTAPVAVRDRRVRRRVILAWGLLVLNALTFYAWIPLAVPVPHRLAQVITQGALPLALLVALTVNRKVTVRPNVFLCLASLLVIETVMTSLQAQHALGTAYRTFRFAEFVAALWLLSPWWGRRDLLLIRSHLTAMGVVLGSVLLGLLVAPGSALGMEGRLAGVVWPIPPTEVAHYAAVTAGLVAVLWFGGLLGGRTALLVIAVTVPVLLLTHTRTALVAFAAGVLVAALSLVTVRRRVRTFFAAVTVAVSLAVMMAAGVVTTWWTRGQSARQLGSLSGRTEFWMLVLRFPRDRFQELFGFGMSNGSIHGLPIDSTWLLAYMEQGLFGVIICAAMVLFLLITAFFQMPGTRQALALFLVTYSLVASFTQMGFVGATTYLLELTLAASLLVPPVTGKRRDPRSSRPASVPDYLPKAVPAHARGNQPAD